MVVKQIYYSSDFIKQFHRLSEPIKKLSIKKEKIFRDNPLHPSLRLHALKGKLSGLFSISVTLNFRVIFKRMPNGDIVFISVGRHDLYGYLK